MALHSYLVSLEASEWHESEQLEVDIGSQFV